MHSKVALETNTLLHNNLGQLHGVFMTALDTDFCTSKFQQLRLLDTIDLGVAVFNQKFSQSIGQMTREEQRTAASREVPTVNLREVPTVNHEEVPTVNHAEVLSIMETFYDQSDYS